MKRAWKRRVSEEAYAQEYNGRIDKGPFYQANVSNKLAFGRFGLKEDPIGLKVTLPWKDSKGDPQTLLGEVISTEYSETRGILHLVVRHFNGEMWPIKPAASAVEVIR